MTINLSGADHILMPVRGGEKNGEDHHMTLNEIQFLW